jgi:hypothetical protein
MLTAPAVMAQTSGATYYVSATGNDENDGLTEATAFKTLSHASFQAKKSDNIKTITVIGTLNEASENNQRNDAVFALLFLDEEEPILITGIPNAPAGRRAVLSGAGVQKLGVSVFLSNVRFEHIEISGSPMVGLYVQWNLTLLWGPVPWSGTIQPVGCLSLPSMMKLKAH